MKRSRTKALVRPLMMIGMLCGLTAPSWGQVAPLIEADVGADKSQFVNPGGAGTSMATMDATITVCAEKRDPVLRQNYVTILNAQSDGSPQDEQRVKFAVSRYDREFTGLRETVDSPQKKRSICTTDTIERAYAEFARSQDRWIDQIVE